MNRRVLPLVAITGVFSALVGCGQVAPSVTGNAINTNSFGANSVAGHALGFRLSDTNRGLSAKRAYRSMVETNLPRLADLRAQCSPVANQGHLGSCTAFAMGKGLREFLELKSGNKTFTDLSPLYLYYKERELQGDVSSDTGSTIATGMEVLADTGIAPEADDPYDITKFAEAPSAQAEKDASQFKISKKVPLNNIDDVKASLAEGYPAAFGFIVYNSFRKIGKDGMMPMPSLFEPVLGGHAVLAVGYDDAKQVIIVRNSWGAEWGASGYFYMPYKFFKGRNVQDIWTAR